METSPLFRVLPPGITDNGITTSLAFLRPLLTRFAPPLKLNAPPIHQTQTRRLLRHHLEPPAPTPELRLLRPRPRKHALRPRLCEP